MSNNENIKKLLALIFSLGVMFLDYNCFSQKNLSEKDIKDKLIRKYPIKSWWKELTLKNMYPQGDDVLKGRYFYLPADLEICDNFLFVADSYLHKILKFDLEGNYIGEIGRKGEAPGEFNFPNNIRSSFNDKLFILEGGRPRMQIIDKMGNYINEFKVFDFINRFIIIENCIYANCFYRDETKKNPLITKYDISGKKVDAFGERIDQKGHRTYDSSVFLTHYENQLVCLFEHYPLMRIYDLDGKIIKEIKIKYMIFKELERLNYQKKFTNPAPNIVRLARLFAGVEATEGRIFVLANLPRLEIIEMDLNGKIKNYYYSEALRETANLSGFDVIIRKHKEIGNIILFYILQSYEEPKLYIFQTKYQE